MPWKVADPRNNSPASRSLRMIVAASSNADKAQRTRGCTSAKAGEVEQRLQRFRIQDCVKNQQYAAA